MFKIQYKAGFVPYQLSNDAPIFMFMIPSDPKFGGDQPQIAKGMIDEGEEEFTSAFREAEEELGLRRSNIIPHTIKHVTTDIKGSVSMAIYMGQVKNLKDFDPPHYETGSVHWLTLDQFRKIGKPSHLHIVEAIHGLLTK
mgnify:CR=1 FL=1